MRLRKEFKLFLLFTDVFLDFSIKWLCMWCVRGANKLFELETWKIDELYINKQYNNVIARYIKSFYGVLESHLNSLRTNGSKKSTGDNKNNNKNTAQNSFDK